MNLTVVTSQSSILFDYTPQEAVLNFIAERLSVLGVIMGKSSAFPHCAKEQKVKTCVTK